ncbi:icaA [Symbiodinium sp. CCMP2592]|nr:icaA [Symbiodinium sp. CCMP2592]
MSLGKVQPPRTGPKKFCDGPLKDGGEDVKPYSHYASSALYTAKPPSEPSLLYRFCKGQDLDTRARATVWYFMLASVALLLATSWASIVALLRPLYPRLHKLPLLHLATDVMMYILAPWPPRDVHILHRNDPGYLREIGCIVPCHRSAGEIADTVASLLLYLEPEHIVVVDNGNSVEPLDDTREVLRALNPSVQYVWLPIGHKANALWKGLSLLPEQVKYIMHIDDDTELPDDFVLDESVWEDPRVHGVSYGIRMRPTGVVQRLVDWEFRGISQCRLFESMYSTVWFQHGIIGIWRRQAFMETMQEHPFLPFGEDNWNGTINLLKQRAMAQELRSSVTTYAPGALFPGSSSRDQGYGATCLWKQRAERWCVNAPRRLWLRLYLMLFYRTGSLSRTLIFQVTSALHLMSVVGHLLAPFILLQALVVFLALDDWSEVSRHMLGALASFAVCQWANGLFLSAFLLRDQPGLQADAVTLLLWPLYSTFLQICTLYGHWRCLLFYIPFFPMRHGLYTEGGMDPDALRQLHGIHCVEEESFESRSTHDGTVFEIDQIRALHETETELTGPHCVLQEVQVALPDTDDPQAELSC